MSPWTQGCREVPWHLTSTSPTYTINTGLQFPKCSKMNSRIHSKMNSSKMCSVGKCFDKYVTSTFFICLIIQMQEKNILIHWSPYFLGFKMRTNFSSSIFPMQKPTREELLPTNKTKLLTSKQTQDKTEIFQASLLKSFMRGARQVQETPSHRATPENPQLH